MSYIDKQKKTAKNSLKFTNIFFKDINALKKENVYIYALHPFVTYSTGQKIYSKYAFFLLYEQYTYEICIINLIYFNAIGYCMEFDLANYFVSFPYFLFFIDKVIYCVSESICIS